MCVCIQTNNNDTTSIIIMIIVDDKHFIQIKNDWHAIRRVGVFVFYVMHVMHINHA